MSSYTVGKLNLAKSQQLDLLARAAGELYTKTVITYWRLARNQRIFLSQYGMEKLCMSSRLHAHTSDAIVGNFYSSIKSAKARKQQGCLEAKYPRRYKWFYKITWKQAAIRVKDGKLVLSNGKGNPKLTIPWQWETPKQVEIGWKKSGGTYELRATYPLGNSANPCGIGVLGVDQGEIRTCTVFDGVNTTIYSGRLLRSKVRYRAKLMAEFDNAISQTRQGSKRRKYLVAVKTRKLARLENQIKDILHKQSTHLVFTQHQRGVQTVVIGDLRDIRDDNNQGKTRNQQLHAWSFGKFRAYVTYKSQRLGMQVVLQEERHTSQTCPQCSNRHKPKGREYKCKCGFWFDRDGVGALNIRAKYLGKFGSPVVGLMASPKGVRFQSHLLCSLGGNHVAA